MVKLLRLRDVVELTRLSRSTIYRRRRAGRFPPARSCAGIAPVWLERDLAEFLEASPIIEPTGEKDGHAKR